MKQIKLSPKCSISRQTPNPSLSIAKNNVRIYLYIASTVLAIDDSNELSKSDLEDYQLLTHFEIKQNPSTNKLRLEFNHSPPSKLKKINSERLNTDESISSYCPKEE